METNTKANASNTETGTTNSQYEISIENLMPSSRVSGARSDILWDIETGRVYEFSAIGSGCPMRAHNGLDVSLLLSEFNVNTANTDDLEELLASTQIQRSMKLIHASFETYWDGSNHRGRINPEAQGAQEALEALDELRGIVSGHAEQLPTFWDADEWFGGALGESEMSCLQSGDVEKWAEEQVLEGEASGAWLELPDVRRWAERTREGAIVTYWGGEDGAWEARLESGRGRVVRGDESSFPVDIGEFGEEEQEEHDRVFEALAAAFPGITIQHFPGITIQQKVSYPDLTREDLIQEVMDSFRSISDKLKAYEAIVVQAHGILDAMGMERAEGRECNRPDCDSLLIHRLHMLQERLTAPAHPTPAHQAQPVQPAHDHYQSQRGDNCGDCSDDLNRPGFCVHCAMPIENSSNHQEAPKPYS